MLPKHSGQFEIKAIAKILSDGSVVAEVVAIVDGVEYRQTEEMESREASMFRREDVCDTSLYRALCAIGKQIKAKGN
jgi:hypothetical protein